jgi:hypothetical protein
LTDDEALAGCDKFQDPRDGLKKESRRAKTKLKEAFFEVRRFNLNNVPPVEDFVKE